MTIKTWIKTLENSRSIRCLEMYLDKKKIVGCETYWAVINTQTRRPDALALPHDHFEKFQIDATKQPTLKIEISATANAIGQRKVVLSDLDVVNHANNVKYMEWCLDYENPERIIQQDVKAFDINFMRELNLNDQATIHLVKNEENSTFGITKENKNAYVLQIEWK